ncbi:MAG: ferritin-like domain-containing protein [Bryobacteraceae bacterium]|nr:ferritin-like domain-containing protein [Bryobacteraceae bacterium]
MSNTETNSVQAAEIRPENRNAQLRRDFLRGVTVVGGAAVSAAVLSSQTTTPPTPSPANDLAILNYALTLELLEATFYTQGLSRFTSAEFASAPFAAALRTASGVSATPPPSGATDTSLVQDVYAYLSIIRNHEQQHVRTLQTTIRSLGGTPVTAPTFTFPYNNVDEFIVLAATLENTGVAAYNGAISMISNPALITASATIATVEARHASYLNRLRGMTPFPDAFDAGRPMSEILPIVSQFIVA